MFLKRNKKDYRKTKSRRLYVLALTLPLLLILLPAVYFGLRFANQTQAVWMDDSWLYRLTLSFTHNSTVTDTKVKFDIDTATLIAAGKMQADCGDSRFTDMNGKVLLYYIDTVGGACNGASTDYYVLVPSINNGANVIYHYYGNSAATNGTQGAQFSQSTTTPSGGAATSGSEQKGVGPTGYWPLDEGTGSTIQDGSSNNNDGSLGASTAAPTWRTEESCVSGKCLQFDGSNDYISIPDQTYLDSTTGSWQGWFKTSMSVSSGYPLIMEKTNASLQSGIIIFLNQTTGSVGYQIKDAAGTTRLNLSSTRTGLNDGLWHHWVATFSDTGTAYLYVDGALQGSGTPSASWTIASTPIRIGVTQASFWQSFTGFIDEPKTSNYALSAQQVRANYLSRQSADTSSNAMGENNQKSLSDGLVGYWPMDETAANSCTGAVNDTCDKSGNGNDIFWTDNATLASGKFGNGLAFDGAGDQAERSLANLSTSIKNLTDQSWGFWYKPTSAASTYALLSRFRGASNDTVWQITQTSSGGITFRASPDGTVGNTTYILTGSNVVSAGVWNHVAVTHKNGKEVVIYINGVEQARGSYTGGLFESGTVYTKLVFGSDCCLNTYLNGVMDDVRIFNRTLSVQEVRQLYTYAPGPVGHWRFDERTGTSAGEGSVNANTGTLTNGPTWTSGKFGAAVRFDGTDDYVSVAHSTSLNISRTITVGAWVYPTGSSANYDKVVMKSLNADASPYKSFELGRDASAQTYYFCVSFTDASQQCDGSVSSLPLNTWSYIGGSYDGTTNRFYLNGVVTSATSVSKTIQTSTQIVSIGANGANGREYYPGAIDDVRIYDYARSASQIIEDMNGGHPLGGSPVGSQLVYWSMDEQTDGTTRNTGNGGTAYNGAANGPAWSAITINECKVNGCLYFNSSADYVPIADGDMAFIDSLTGFATSFWIQPTTLATDRSIVSKNDTSQRSFAVVTDATNSDEIRVHIAASAGEAANTTYCTTTGLDLSTSVWQHVTISYDGTQGTAANRVKVYKNGRAIACSMTGTLPTAMTSGSTSAFRLGDDVSATYTSLVAYIDEFKMYNASLSPDQALIEANYGSGIAYSTGQSESKQITGVSETQPIGYWNFDDRTGTTAKDSSGNGNNGTLTNGPTWSSGKVGSGVLFDGSNDYVTIPDIGALDLSSGFTEEVWIYVTAGAGTYRDVFMKGVDTTGSEDLNYYIQIADTDKAEVGFRNTLGVFQYVQSLTTINLNEWYHIAGTYDATANRLRVYVNGKLDNSTTTANTPGMNALPLLIGIGDTANFRPFPGRIDDARLFNYERTIAQVAYDYNRGAPIGHWQFDECSGSTAYDASGNGNNATLTYGGGTYTQVGSCTSGTASDAWYGGATGKINSSLAMDSTTDTINVGNIGLYTFERTTPFSTSIWIKTSTNGSMTLMSKQDSSAPFSGWNIQTGLSLVYFQLVNTYSSNTLEVRNANSFTYADGNWHNIITTYDGSSTPAGIHIYIDGKDQALTTGFNSLSASITNSIPMYIGSRNGTAQKYSGQLDDARLYNYVLTASQVKKLYNDGASVRFAPTTGQP